MPIEKEKFRAYTLEDERDGKQDIINCRLNLDERAWLDQCKELLEQPKDSTCLKQLAEIGMQIVLHDGPTRVTIGTIFKNKRRNDRTGAMVDTVASKQM